MGKIVKSFLTKVLYCREKGTNRRCGGQGDILAGIIAAGVAAAVAKHQRAINLLDICYNACIKTRKIMFRTFESRGGSMITSDAMHFM